MVIPKNIHCNVFSKKVVHFVMNELEFMREHPEQADEQAICPINERHFTQFYKCVGKAATVLALMNREKVKFTLLRKKETFPRSARVLDEFVQSFSSSYFQRIENLPREWFPVVVLTYCGVVGVIADCCKLVNRPDMIDVCYKNLEMDMRTCIEDIQDTGGWRPFYDAASTFAVLYDTKFWKKEDDDEDDETAQKS